MRSTRRRDGCTPLLTAGLHPVPRGRVVVPLVVALEQRQMPPRALRPAHVPRHHRRPDTRHERGTSVSITLGLVLDRSSYLQTLRDEKSEEAEAASRT
jgi:hypothetical protein